jgi:hypothetical protein
LRTGPDHPGKEFSENITRLPERSGTFNYCSKKIKDGEYNVPQSFTDWLESMLHQLKFEWQKKYDKKEIKKQLRALKKLIHDHKHKSNSIKFAKDKNDKIASLKNVRPLSDDQIHSGRKTLKEN